MNSAWRLRAAVLLLLGLIVVHEGRYLLAPPEHLHGGLHAYLAWLVPLAALLALLGLAEFAVRALRRSHGEEQTRLPGGPVLAAAFSAILLTLFGLQEVVELALVDGALPRENVFIADGGWVATPLALLVAGLLSLLLRGAARLIATLARRPHSHLVRPAGARRPAAPGFKAPASPLAQSLAPRGPPPLLP